MIIALMPGIPLVIGCAGQGGSTLPILPAPSVETRPFYMGLSAFPWALSDESIQWNFARIATDADMVAHHLDNGVPWDVCLSGAPFPANVANDLQTRKDRTPEGHKVYVAVTPLDFNRANLAPIWNSAGDNQPLPAPWNGYAFNHANVKTAYLEYCRRIIAHFNPDYLNIAIEANLLKENSPAKWSAFMELHSYVYGRIKAEHPDLVVLVSVTGIDLVEGYTGADHAAQMQALSQLMEFSDYYGISLHPHITAYAPALEMPVTMFDDIFSLSTKPACICETSFPAQDLTITVPVNYTCNGTAEKQRIYMTDLLTKASQYRLRFVVNYLVRDYDQLCIDAGWTDGPFLLWRDTGLYDEGGLPRPALTEWKNVLSRPVAQ